MFKKFLQHSAIARTLQNRDGIAAIEFALIAPIMIALYVGLAEISLLVAADRNVSHAASVTGDLATQVAVLDNAAVENILQATLAVMNTDFTKSGYLTVDMRSFEMDSDGNKNEIGYVKLGSGLTTKFDPTSVNATLLNETSGLIVTRVSYNYHSPSREFVGTPTLEETFMLKPRLSATIPFENDSGGTVSPTMACTLSQLSGKIKVTCI